MPTLRSVNYDAILENSNYMETANIHVLYLIIIILKIMCMNRKTRKRTNIRHGSYSWLQACGCILLSIKWEFVFFYFLLPESKIILNNYPWQNLKLDFLFCHNYMIFA